MFFDIKKQKILTGLKTNFYLKKFVDKGIYVVGILGPISTIPQLLEIWISQNASGLSLMTWLLWISIAFFWLLYGILHKEKPIIISYIIWIIVDTIVILGIILYK